MNTKVSYLIKIYNLYLAYFAILKVVITCEQCILLFLWNVMKILCQV
jgi:hypothetical protein